MADEANGILVCYNQSQRIAEHPFETDENLIVIDNLEEGKLRLFEYISGPLNIQQLLWNDEYKNAVLIAEAIINRDWKEKGVFIHKVSFNYGYDYLITPMIHQILHFSEFYYIRKPVKISKVEYEKCFLLAKEAFSDFQCGNNHYVKKENITNNTNTEEVKL